jgi:hypothetical protein
MIHGLLGDSSGSVYTLFFYPYLKGLYKKTFRGFIENPLSMLV